MGTCPALDRTRIPLDTTVSSTRYLPLDKYLSTGRQEGETMLEIKPDEDQPNLVIVELLGLIDKMANSNHRLEAVIREYQAMVHALREQGGRLVDQRDRARSVAAMLEAECAACWGPVHAETLHGIRKGLDYGA